MAGRDEADVWHVDATVALRPGVGGGHAVAERDALGGEVGVADDGADLRGAEGGEGIVLAGSGGLGGVAMVPVGAFEEVADLQDFLSFPGLHGQAALANHLSGLAEEDGPESEAPALVASELPVQPVLDFSVAERALVGDHGLVVLEESAEGGEVVWGEFAEEEPVGLNDDGEHGVRRGGGVRRRG